MQKTYGQYCGLSAALDKVGDRWSLLLIRELLTGPKRFSDLKRVLPGMATNLLTGRLRHLQAEGLVTHRALPTGAVSPPSGPAWYSLTPLGRALEDPVRALVRWGGHVLPSITVEGAGGAGYVHWLLVTLPAILGDTAPEDLHLDVRLDVDGMSLGLRARDGSLWVEEEYRGVPDGLRVAIDYRSLLAYLTGAVPLKNLEASGHATLTGPKMARARFETLVNTNSWYRNAGALSVVSL